MRKLATGKEIKRTQTFRGDTLFQQGAAPRMVHDPLNSQMPSALPGACSPSSAGAPPPAGDEDDFQYQGECDVDMDEEVAAALLPEEDHMGLGGSMFEDEGREDPPRKIMRGSSSASGPRPQPAQEPPRESSQPVVGPPAPEQSAPV